MKIVYSNHVYGDKVSIILESGKKVTLKADEEIEVTDAEGKNLLELEAFTVVKGTKTTKTEDVVKPEDSTETKEK
jgi:hypothetical protein